MGNFLEWYKKSQLNESRTVYKGWIHLRKRKTIIWQTIAKPWHVQKIAQNPKQFGYTKQDLIDAVENGPQVLMVPVEDFVEQLAVGDRDVQWDIESMLFRDGWSKITVDLIDGASDIYARDLKSGAEIVKILLKEVEALPLTRTYIWVGKDRITRSKREAKLEIPQDYEDFVQTGKAPDTRRKRTEIGRTMAMFRESVESEASFRAHWKKAPSSYDYKLSTMQGQNEYWNAYFKHFEDKYGELPSRIKKAIREAGFKSNPTITHKGERFTLRTGMDQLDLLYHVYSTMNESKLQEKTYAKSGLGKWMNQQSAGGGAGWDRYSTTGSKLGKCGDAEEGEPYSACLSRQKADKLGKKGIASFVRRKRAAQEKAGRGDIGDGEKGKKPVYVKTGITDKDPKKKGIQDDWSMKYKKSIDCNNPKGFSQRAHCQGRKKREENMLSFKEFSEERKNEPTNPSLWKKAIALAKKKFDVYPSAYANAWASKWYKGEGGGWRAVSK